MPTGSATRQTATSRQHTAPRPRALYWGISIGLAAVLLFLSLRGVAWVAVARILASARLLDIAICCVLISLNLLLRAARWRVLLSAEAPVPIVVTFWATSAGYFGNAFLPARGGELIRTVMISARTGLSRTYVLTVALSERLADAIVLVVISGCVLTLVPTKVLALREAGKTVAVFGLIGLLALAILPYTQTALERFIRRIPIPRAIGETVERATEQILRGVRSFHHLPRLFTFAAFTAIIWSVDGLITVAGGRALGLSIPFSVALLLLAGLGLGSAIPSTPGYVGVYQFVAVSVLVPFGFTAEASLAYILLFQAQLYAIITFWGVLALCPLGRGRRTGQEQERALSQNPPHAGLIQNE